MYTSPPPKCECNETEPAKDMVSEMAQRLYDHFASMNLDQDQWLNCLENFLVEEEGKGMTVICPADVEAKIAVILRDDKHIPLNQLSEDAKKAVFREVAEWLVAEKICEKMINYERSIAEGLESRKFRRLYDVEVMHVWNNDGDTFGNAISDEELSRFIHDNYVVDIEGRVLGAGARVEVRELKPVKFPLPYPTKNELQEGLMIMIPNRFLVLRLTKHSYREVLGSGFMEREVEATKAFNIATEVLCFSEREEVEGSVSENVCEQVEKTIPGCLDVDDLTVKRRKGREKHSFLPPGLIVKASIGQGGLREYMTIQKKIPAKGTVIMNNRQMKKDLNEIPGFRDMVSEFIRACKNLHVKTGILPDLVGGGNVLYTRRGNVYQVDINNMVMQPDNRLVCLIGLAKDLLGRSVDGNLDEETRANFVEQYHEVRADIFNHMKGDERYKKFCEDAVLDRILTKLFVDCKDLVLVDFFRTARLIDDLYHPIFFHNSGHLMGLEMDVLRSAKETGEISEEEYGEKWQALFDDPLYGQLHSNERGVKYHNKKNCEGYLKMKRGDEAWMKDYLNFMYNFFTKDGFGSLA